MRLSIRTHVLCSFATMLVLLVGVAAVAINRTDQVGELAGDLNSRVLTKTRIADEIVDLGQEIRSVESFMLRSADPAHQEFAASMIQERVAAVAAKTASYLPYIDTDIERSLLQNLKRSRSAYLALQGDILSKPLAERRENEAADTERLAEAFDQANRQARGLAHLAEAQARSARAQAVGIVEDARVTILVAGALGFAIGFLLLLLLLTGIFRPLSDITKALISLAEGRLDVSPFPTGRGGEIDAMVQALDVFRTNAIELQSAHEETKAAHQRADLLARHDSLTGLSNRRVLAGSIDDAIGRCNRKDTFCAVVVLDLDRFKPINDIYGHGAGDKVLCKVAERLRVSARSGETIARLGGDEFAAVLEFEPGSEAPVRFAKRALKAITAPMEIDGRSVSVGTSIGIAVWPSDGEGAEALLHSADLAMFKAKRDAPGSFRFFEPEMDIQLRARADLELRIRQAIENGEIRPYYQPLVDLRQERITGFEILARWHDQETVRAPGEFLQIADEAGLIPDMTYCVLRQACRDARGWPDDLTLALNVTPAQISDLRFPHLLLDLLAEEGFPPARLEVEITENALIGDITAAKSVIADLRKSGIRISLDDFGTGYSSLQHLHDLKIDKIKIDQSFVRSMRNNADSTKIVETVLSLGRSLGIFTIAEGIEDGEHLRALISHGCEYGQGYHLGRPQSAADVGSLLRREAPVVRAA